MNGYGNHGCTKRHMLQLPVNQLLSICLAVGGSKDIKHLFNTDATDEKFVDVNMSEKDGKMVYTLSTLKIYINAIEKFVVSGT